MDLRNCVHILTLYSAMLTFNVMSIYEREVLDRIFNSSNYDATVGPYAITGEPTVVAVDFDIIALGPVNDLLMEYSTSLYFRQEWYDPRLKHSESGIRTSHRHLSYFWVPDLFFPRSKTETRHDVTEPNMYIKIHPNGSVIYSQRLSLTVSCLMDLRKFPLDKQTCSLRIESYSYTTEEVRLVWSSERKSSTILPSANIPDFELNGISSHDCTSKLQTGEYPCLYATLEMERQIGYYLTQTYLPTTLIVVLSWVSFWIDPDAIPARISVGLLTVLTITTQSSGARSQLPRVPYTKSVDVWMSACLIFVFAAYIEYAFVTVLSRKFRKCSNRASTSSSKESILPRQESVQNINGRRERKPPLFTGRDNGRMVDKTSRYFFPGAFLVFNLCYWLYYIDL
ncbi:glycine receptor subunit alpha-2 [Patella vulgata]|uniref:glycine receptor subunit alpha-2 n=1 Tax=Patella vulgata TaxID=6465 RepID=UPI00217F57BF|nr:glycine receptor subunit alpha-2 [Patella vulgata]